jgi:hypothetical protein
VCDCRIFVTMLLNFNKEHKAMLGHCKMIMEQEAGNELSQTRTHR